MEFNNTNINTRKSLQHILDKFINIFDITFLELKIEVKQKKMWRPWITRGLKKSSKKKQLLYEKLFKYRNDRNEKAHKLYKNLFEKLKLQSRKLYFQNKLKQYNNFKNIWKIMKVIIGNSKAYNENLPKCLNIDRKKLLARKPLLKNSTVII